MDSNDIRQPIPLVKRGDKFSMSTHLNNMANAINQRRGSVNPPTQKMPAISGSTASTRFKVQSVQGDYVTCLTWDGTTLGSTSILVAKPPLLRNSLTTRDTLTFTYPTVQTRVASDGTNTENQEVVSMYLAGDELYATADPDGGTGVIVSGVELDYIDDNRDARNWAKS